MSVFQKKDTVGKDAEKINIEAMHEALFSTCATVGGWIFVPKEKLINYEVCHLASMDLNGLIKEPQTMKSFTYFFAYDENDDMRRNVIVFDTMKSKDIKYFGFTLESQKGNNNFEI